jgi:hypothetical protein
VVSRRPVGMRQAFSLAAKDLPLRCFELFIQEQSLSPKICKLR